MRAAVRRALSTSASGCVLCLHIGMHQSVLAAADRNRLAFVRQLGVGLQALVAALSREPAGRAGVDGVLDAGSALDLLLDAGLPRGDEHGGERGAGRVLPLLQPGIQRLVVETRQSIRFGLSDEARRGARIIIEGPGAAVPRLAEVIAQQVGLPFVPIESARGDGGARQQATGVTLLPADGRGVPSLLPESLAARELASRVRRGLAVGTAAAMAVIAVEAIGVSRSLGQAERELERVRSDAARLGPVAELHQRLTQTTATLASVRGRSERAIGPDPKWHAALVLLSEVVPESVRLGQVSFTVDGGVPTMRIYGQTLSGGDGEGSTMLRQLLSTLSAAPMVSEARLGATQLVESRWGTSQSFDLTVSLVPLPFEPLVHAAEGSRP